MAYLFLKSADRHEHRNSPRWWAISEDRIETLNVSDSYDQFWQPISSSDAGDYIEILSQAAADVANRAYNEDVEPGDEDFKVVFEMGESVNAYDQCAVFDAIIESDLQDGVDYNLERTEFSGFNYWDGSNHKTIVVSSIDDNNTHEIEDDEAIVARLNEALENEEFVSEGFGTKTYRYKDAKITYSQFSSAWEYAEITLDNECAAEFAAATGEGAEDFEVTVFQPRIVKRMYTVSVRANTEEEAVGKVRDMEREGLLLENCGHTELCETDDEVVPISGHLDSLSSADTEGGVYDQFSDVSGQRAYLWHRTPNGDILDPVSAKSARVSKDWENVGVVIGRDASPAQHFAGPTVRWEIFQKDTSFSVFRGDLKVGDIAPKIVGGLVEVLFIFKTPEQ